MDRREQGRASRIRSKLHKELDPLILEVDDVSHEHAGHSGVQGLFGETHFNIKIVSPKFEGQNSLKRHRLVYDLLSDELQNGLHAVSIQAKTPGEMGKSRG
eukprot:TRINITY_DN13846_c0_g1_i1.p1 TRINITY_DN13846_c0_g1~~TRINITY_DN13846_c0_g1_i1.p1  ORF type:complete len:101 (-),score=9.60 TRINITY_DN13846_c0_g1_i1:264-566(-)